MLPNKDTLKRWRGEGIKPPCVIVDPHWRCPVCNARREELRYVSDKTPEAVACSICDLPFSLPHTNQAPPLNCLPLPAVSDEWAKAWRLAFKDDLFKRTCLTHGQRGFSRLLLTFETGRDALDFFEKSERWVAG